MKKSYIFHKIIQVIDEKEKVIKTLPWDFQSLSQQQKIVLRKAFVWRKIFAWLLWIIIWLLYWKLWLFWVFIGEQALISRWLLFILANAFPIIGFILDGVRRSYEVWWEWIYKIVTDTK